MLDVEDEEKEENRAGMRTTSKMRVTVATRFAIVARNLAGSVMCSTAYGILTHCLSGRFTIALLTTNHSSSMKRNAAVPIPAVPSSFHSYNSLTEAGAFCCFRASCAM